VNNRVQWAKIVSQEGCERKPSKLILRHDHSTGFQRPRKMVKIKYQKVVKFGVLMAVTMKIYCFLA
jgi:hypothetical protein